MKTILVILQKAGGFRPSLYIKIENPPYVELVVEAVCEPGPMGRPTLSVGHYGQQDGERMRDPVMYFELVRASGTESELAPFYWRNDYLCVEEWSRALIEGQYFLLPDLYRKHQDLAVLWDNTLEQLGYQRVFNHECILR